MVQVFDDSLRKIADEAPERDGFVARVRAIVAELLDFELEDELRYLRGWSDDEVEVLGLA